MPPGSRCGNIRGQVSPTRQPAMVGTLPPATDLRAIGGLVVSGSRWYYVGRPLHGGACVSRSCLGSSGAATPANQRYPGRPARSGWCFAPTRHAPFSAKSQGVARRAEGQGAVMRPSRNSRQLSPRSYGAAPPRAGGSHTTKPGALLLGVIHHTVDYLGGPDAALPLRRPSEDARPILSQ